MLGACYSVEKATIRGVIERGFGMDAKLIGMKLTELRGEKQQYEVADAIGISRSALSMYEAGERIPRDEVKVKLARYYGCSIESIFFSENATNRGV